MVEGLYCQDKAYKQYFLIQLGPKTTNLTRTDLKAATFLDAKALRALGWERLSPKQMVLWDD
jgi:hypothetical protein